MNTDDYETWVSADDGVTPTLNAFDNATETRATVVHVDTIGVRRLTPIECERLQGFPDGWTEGQSDSARYKQLGNAVTVPVAEWIGRRLMEGGTHEASASGRTAGHGTGTIGAEHVPVAGSTADRHTAG